MQPRRPGSPAALCLALAGTLACATSAPAPPRSSLPVLEDGDTQAALGYETPPTQRATDVLPPDLRSGPHHTVSERVPTDGFIRSYTIESDFGRFQVQGDPMLRARVAEIRALAELQELSASHEFAAALGRTASSPFVATWNLVTKPVQSISGIPRGAANALRRVSELSRGERSELEDSALGEFFGFEARKRAIAHRLGVDPYSSNPVLQTELNRFAWVSYIGGFGAMLVPFASNAGSAQERTPFSGGREEEILEAYAPEDLRRLNRIELAVMGIPEEVRRPFIAHPWYSPRQQSLLVAHLAALDLVENRAAFIVAATQASSELDALLYTRTAQMLRYYHEEVTPLESIAPFRDIVIGVTSDQRLVVPLALDYAVWTRAAHALANSLKRSTLADGREITGREIVVTGTFSPKARAKIESRGIVVVEQALAQPAAAHDTAQVAH